MKNPIKLIKEVFSARGELAKSRSWTIYLENEVAELEAKSRRDNFSINDLVRENEMLSGANTKLVKELSDAQGLLGGLSKEGGRAPLTNVWRCRNCRKGNKALKRAARDKRKVGRATEC